jgi:hypothetical protein
MMRTNPTRLAWTVLLAAFITFCVLAMAIPLGIRWYLVNAREGLPTALQVSSGTVMLEASGGADPIAVVETRSLRAPSRIQTDQSSQATLVFTAGEAEGSPELATVQVYPNAEVEVLEASRPRYAAGDGPDRIVLEVGGGRVRVNTAEAYPRGLYTEIQTPQTTIALAPGSYAVDVSNEETMVATRFGQATVAAAGTNQVVETGSRAEVATGQPVGDPAALDENLIANGDFTEPLGPPTWLTSVFPDEDPTSGTVAVVDQGGRNAAHFSRLNQPPTHTEVAITQVLDRPVHDYESLNLQMDVLLRWQSLPGAGERSSEFPLMFRLDYDDIYGNHQFWTHGFHYRDPSPNWVVTGGTQIPQNLWFPYESGNLFDLLQEEGLPPPASLNYLRIYASGHNYDSLVSEVRLTAR